MKLRARMLSAAGVAVASATMVVTIGLGTAAAKPKPLVNTKVPGVSMEDMWRHCNAFDGDYSEGPGWAECILPNGQRVFCNSDGCWISDVVTEPPVVPTVRPTVIRG